MKLGELNAFHIGRAIKRGDGPARVVASVRHWTLTAPDGKTKERHTSVMVQSPTKEGELNEVRGFSDEEVTLT